MSLTTAGNPLVALQVHGLGPDGRMKLPAWLDFIAKGNEDLFRNEPPE